MNDVPERETCTACGAVEEIYQVYRFTPGGKGPFCSACWKAFNDPDQALVTEERLAGLEMAVGHYKYLLGRAADALDIWLVPNRQAYWQSEFVEQHDKLIAELRKAAE